MLLNKSYYYWYYRLVFLFRFAVSIWKRTYVNIQHEIYIHKAVTQDLYLLLLFLFFVSSSSSLSIFLLQGVWEDGVFYDRFYCIAQADHQI